MDQPIEQLIHKFSFLDFSSTYKPEISIQEFENGITHFIALCADKSPAQLSTPEIEKMLKAILFYFGNPLKVKNAAPHGGLNALRKKYDADLIRIQFSLKQKTEIHIPHPEKFVAGLGLFGQTLKVQNAYRAILKGKKFIKAGLKESDYKDVNPIEQISKQNIQKLKNFLKESGANTNSFGLRPDELELFKTLLDLPYKLQHATNYYYPVVNSGSLDSYTEIQRHNPDFESPFSTKGNIEKLGNGGFVFFRQYVDGVNGSETRYGDTSITFDLQLLRKCGWISLHDQLVPLSKASTKNFYWENRLLRKAKVVKINNNTKDKTLHDGLCYEYRTLPITNYAKRPKDALNQLGNKITSQTRTFSFTEEIFYGADILPGIALSVIRELRYLEACGFRQHFIELFSNATPEEKPILLGKLIKSLYRIEGKYPAALRLNLTQDNNAERPDFTPIAASDHFAVVDQHAVVKNPDGDKRYNLNLGINVGNMELAKLKSEQKKIEEELSNTQRQRARFEKENDMIKEKMYSKIIKQLKHLAIENNRQIDLVEQILRLSPEISKRICESNDLYRLLLKETIEFEEISTLSIEEINILCEYDVSKPIYERGYSVSELLLLYKENRWHLKALTCDNLTDLVLDIAPDVNKIVMEYANDDDVNIDWVIDQLCESDQQTLKMNLGFYEEPVSDNDEPYQEESIEDHLESDQETYNNSDIAFDGKQQQTAEDQNNENVVNIDALLNFHLLKTNGSSSSQSEQTPDLSQQSVAIGIPGLD